MSPTQTWKGSGMGTTLLLAVVLSVCFLVFDLLSGGAHVCIVCGDAYGA